MWGAQESALFRLSSNMYQVNVRVWWIYPIAHGPWRDAKHNVVCKQAGVCTQIFCNLIKCGTTYSSVIVSLHNDVWNGNRVYSIHSDTGDICKGFKLQVTAGTLSYRWLEVVPISTGAKDSVCQWEQSVTTLKGFFGNTQTLVSHTSLRSSRVDNFTLAFLGVLAILSIRVRRLMSGTKRELRFAHKMCLTCHSTKAFVLALPVLSQREKWIAMNSRNSPDVRGSKRVLFVAWRMVTSYFHTEKAFGTQEEILSLG